MSRAEDLGESFVGGVVQPTDLDHDRTGHVEHPVDASVSAAFAGTPLSRCGLCSIVDTTTGRHQGVTR
jgi:hypothetical protein